MHDFPISDDFRRLLWIFQTQLKPSEIRKVVHRFRSGTQNNLKCMSGLFQTLDFLPGDILENLRSNFFSFSENEKKLSVQISCYLELEALLKTVLPPSFPCAISYSGNPDILRAPRVGIIGARHPTFYGREQAYRFAKALAKAGCTIVSGGAIGIDTIANSTAIEFGNSCAVLGSGLNNPYPLSNSSLFREMCSSPRGLLISEFSLDARAQKWHFPKRNTTIASLCDFLLVIEATKTSGSLITANAALDLGRDIGALPGAIDSPLSEGTNWLIQNGAFCIQSPDEVIERLKSLESTRRAFSATQNIQHQNFTPTPSTGVKDFALST